MSFHDQAKIFVLLNVKWHCTLSEEKKNNSIFAWAIKVLPLERGKTSNEIRILKKENKIIKKQLKKNIENPIQHFSIYVSHFMHRFFFFYTVANRKKIRDDEIFCMQRK